MFHFLCIQKTIQYLKSEPNLVSENSNSGNKTISNAVLQKNYLFLIFWDPFIRHNVTNTVYRVNYISGSGTSSRYIEHKNKILI